MKGSWKVRKNPKTIAFILTVAVFCTIGVGSVVFMAIQYLGLESIGGPGTEIPTVSTTTFKTYSYMDGEDVSNFVPLTIWVPEDDAEFDDFDDIFTMSNFEEEESAKDAEDISIDISDYYCIWVEVDPAGETVFSNNFQLIFGGSNRVQNIYVYDLTSDVNFNAYNRDTLDELTLGDYATDSNITIIMDCPHYTTSNIHANDDPKWEVSEEDWDEMTTSEKEEYWDEKDWACQAPLYDPSVDLEKDYDDELEQLTNAFALKLDFNASISTTDGASTQINLTLADEDQPFEIVISGDIIYLIAYEVITFEDGPYMLGLEIEFGAEIHLDDIDSGRLVVPRDDDSLGAFTKYSDIAA